MARVVWIGFVQITYIIIYLLFDVLQNWRAVKHLSRRNALRPDIVFFDLFSALQQVRID